MRRSLNPFHGLPNAREVWAWGMYDLANQSFTLLVTTLFFAVYFDTTVAGSEDRGRPLRNLSFAAASLIVLLVSPVLGALADFSGRKKRFLAWFCVLCAVPTAGLALAGPGDVWLALVLYTLANVFFMGGENFLAAFLPEISTRETVGRVSAIGWTMGYIGALICLPLSLAIPGVVTQSEAGLRMVFVFAGVWFLANAVPTLVWLRERKAPETLPPDRTMVGVGFSRLAETAGQVRHFRHLVLFLAFFVVYCCGMQVIIVNAGTLAFQHIKGKELVLFIWALSAIAGVGSVAGGVMQGRVGLKLTLIISLAIWLLTALGAALLPPSGVAPWQIWIVGAGVGIGLGMTGTASRALVGVFTPAHKTAEFFSFWGLGYKIAGVAGPAAYAAIVGASATGQRDGMLLVAASFAVGLVGVCFVRVAAGQRAAEEAERAAGHLVDMRDLAKAAREVGQSEVRAVQAAIGDPAGPADTGRPG